MSTDLPDQQEAGRKGPVSSRLRGEARAATGRLLAERYETGTSIREVAGEFSLSYGLTRSLLLEAGVELRARGRAAA